MVGFFSRIRGMFSADYSGRYMSTLLCELAYQDHVAFSRIFDLDPVTRDGLRSRSLQIVPEWSFRVDGRSDRRTDLAILRGGEPVLLVEVKEDDVASKRNPAQLADYLGFVASRKGATRFAHVSRYSPTGGDAAAMRQAEAKGLPVASLRYRDFYGALEKSGKEFCRLFRDYLKDIGVATYKTIDFDSETRELTYFLVQSLGFPHKHGMGKLHSQKAVDGMPETLAKLLGNLEVLGEWVQNSNPSLFRHRFIRRYRPRQIFDIASLKRALASYDDEPAEMPGTGRFVKSGIVDFSAHGAIGGGTIGEDGEGTGSEWLTCEIGVSFSIETRPAEKGLPPAMTFYACFYGAGLDWTDAYSAKRGGSTYPSEPKAMEIFRRLLRDALKKAVEVDGEVRHPALRNFVVP